MSINFENALGIREHAMRLRADRANVLSSNLANIDTPNYKARDIDFQAALKSRMNQGSPSRIHATHSGHISNSQIVGGDIEKKYRVPSQPSIDGNSVEEHVEHAEFMKNNLDFQVAFTLLNSGFKGLSKALRGE